MGVTRYEVSETIDAPAAEVFARSVDLERWAETISGITRVEKLTDGPVGVGTRFRETRVMMGKEAVEEMEFAAIEPGSSYALRCESCGCLFESTMSFSPVSRGTRVSLVTESTPQTLMAKITGPIFGPMMKKMMLKCLQQDLADLKNACEGGESPEGQHAGSGALPA